MKPSLMLLMFFFAVASSSCGRNDVAEECLANEKLVEVCERCGPAGGCERTARRCMPLCVSDGQCGVGQRCMSEACSGVLCD